MIFLLRSAGPVSRPIREYFLDNNHDNRTIRIAVNQKAKHMNVSLELAYFVVISALIL